MAELMPITSPCMSKAGPPELPGLIGASSCRKWSNGPSPISRPSAETMPSVKELPSANGLPAASTQSPTWILAELPHCATGSFLVIVDFHDRDVREIVRRDDPAGETLAIVERDDDARRPLHDMVIGDDHAVISDDEAGARGLGDLLGGVGKPRARRRPRARDSARRLGHRDPHHHWRHRPHQRRQRGRSADEQAELRMRRRRANHHGQPHPQQAVFRETLHGLCAMPPRSAPCKPSAWRQHRRRQICRQALKTLARLTKSEGVAPSVEPGTTASA